MSKPTNKPGWTSTSNPSSEPTSKKLTGWSAGEKPSAEHMNWLFKNVSEWINHVDVDQVKGETGDQGPQGEQGIEGASGEQGETGATGLKGETGDKGLDGDQGPQGPTGSGSFDSTTNTRVVTLESKARISSPSSATMTLSYQGSGISSEYNAGNSGSAITIDWSNGTSQFVVITNDGAVISFSNPISGKVYYLRLKNNDIVDKNVTFVGANPGINYVESGFTKIISLYYNGSSYVVQKINSLFGSISGSETKSGYIATGATGITASNNVTGVQKINFNIDTLVTVTSLLFGKGINSSGTIISESITSSLHFGFGTQSSSSGYRFRATYLSLVPSGGTVTTAAGSKMSFATEVSSLIRTTSSGSIGLDRRPVAQSGLAAFVLNSASPYSAKLDFSTDTYSSPATLTLAFSSPNYAGAISSETQGIYFDGSASTTVRLLDFSSETASTVTAPQTYAASCSELVDAPLSGYSQNTQTTTSGGTSNCRKYDKTTYSNGLLATTLAGVGGISAATQGTMAGYFCGGQNYSASNYDINTIGSSMIKKIGFSTDTYSLHSALLKNSIILGAGFEG